jgi:hypothetical protein
VNERVFSGKTGEISLHLRQMKLPMTTTTMMVIMHRYFFFGNVSFPYRHVIDPNIGDDSRRCVLLLRRDIILVVGHGRARIDFEIGREGNGIDNEKIRRSTAGSSSTDLPLVVSLATLAATLDILLFSPDIRKKSFSYQEI